MFATSIFVLLRNGFLVAAGTFTWTAPPPTWSPKDGNDIRTVNFPVLNGSTNVALRWNYVLGDREELYAISWTIDGNQIASLSAASQVTIKDDRFSVNKSEVATLIIKNVSDIEDITIQCRAQTDGNLWKYNIQVEITVPPKITSYTHNITADEGSKLDLFCNTTGKPAPSITWTTVLKDGTNSNLKVLYVGNPWNISNIRRNYSGTYHCIADNGIGSPINRAISVNVLYKPLANSLKRRTVSEGEHVKISCLEDSGNPSAVITWYKGNDTSGNKMIKSSTLEFQNASSSDEGWYSCFATKGIENVSATFFLSVVQKTSPAPTTEPSTASILCSEAPSANKFRGSATVEADCKNRSQVAAKLVHQFVELLKNEDSELGKSCGTSCGSVVVDFILKFRRAVEAARVVTILKEAAEQDRFNGLKVYPDSIIQISSTTTLSANTVRPYLEERCHKSFWIKENCEKNMLAIVLVIGLAAGVLCVCFLLIWWVHKKRNCKKDSKEAVSPGDFQPLSSNHSTLSDGVPCDYGKSGQQPLKDHRVEQQQGAVGSEAISTHAVVDKSGKKVKKKTNKAVEQKPVADQYAVMDESKKEKKNQAGNTSAEIDMSKKPTKKPKPGEILYDDLGEFHQMKKMPEVSTSTETLPPIKRPEAYAKTQYAEITQYLKGNPEDPGAELLKDSITPAVTNTATGSRVESSAGNTGDGAEATIETGV